MIYRIEPATGSASKSIRLKTNDEANYNYLPINECTLNWEQTFEIKYLIQGGPRANIADIGLRVIKGKLSMPLRVDINGDLLPGVISILRCAEFQVNNTYLEISTNHFLSPSVVPYVVADGWASNNIGLLNITTCLISNLSIEGRSGGNLTLSCDISGIIDSRNISDVISLDDIDLSGRELVFADCKAYRYEARLPISMFQVNVKSTITEDVFINPPGTPISMRSDQAQFISANNWESSGKYEQFVKKRLEKSSFLQGGIMQNQNMTFEIGPLKVIYYTPMFNVSTQNIDPKLIKRTATFTNITPPFYMENTGFNFFNY